MEFKSLSLNLWPERLGEGPQSEGAEARGRGASQRTSPCPAGACESDTELSCYTECWAE